MKIRIYPLDRKDRTIGFITFNKGNVFFDFEDKKLSKKLELTYKQRALYKRILVEDEFNFGFYIKELDKNSLDYFKEFIYLLPEFNLGGEYIMDKLNYVLALDFDGVIVDSVKEAFEVSKNTFNFIYRKEIIDSSFFRDFKKYRVLCRSGMDFFAVLYLLSNNKEVNLINISYIKEELKDDIFEFEKNYYNIRAKLSNQDYKKWLSMHTFYPFIEQEIKELKQKFFKVVIATTKDKESVLKILKTKNLLFEKIYDKDISHNKEEHIYKISKDYNISLKNIILIDDILANLLAVKKTGCKVFMASWGYNSSFEQKKAKEEGIIVLDYKNIFNQLVKALNLNRR